MGYLSIPYAGPFHTTTPCTHYYHWDILSTKKYRCTGRRQVLVGSDQRTRAPVQRWVDTTLFEMGCQVMVQSVCNSAGLYPACLTASAHPSQKSHHAGSVHVLAIILHSAGVSSLIFLPPVRHIYPIHSPKSTTIEHIGGLLRVYWNWCHFRDSPIPFL